VIPRPTRGLLVLLLLAVALTILGCGAGSGSDGVKIAGDQFRLSGTQRDAQFAVGSEGFTEQEVLGNIAIEVLEAADATVIDRTGLGGNEEVRHRRWSPAR
jgi:osmoprotectant transport system substrate-binding protein